MWKPILTLQEAFMFKENFHNTKVSSSSSFDQKQEIYILMLKKNMRRMRSPYNYKKPDQYMIELLHYARRSIQNVMTA